MASATLVADHLAKRIVLKVRITGLKRMSLRFRMAALIIRLAAVVAGTQVDVTR